MEKELRIYTRVYGNKDDYEVAMEMIGELVVARDGAALCALGSALYSIYCNAVTLYK
jgi:hypothetical protein